MIASFRCGNRTGEPNERPSGIGKEVFMTRLAFALLNIALMNGVAFAGDTRPDVPEIDNAAGFLALAAVAGVVAIVRERMRG